MRLSGEESRTMLYEMANSGGGGLFITSLAVFLATLTETLIANSLSSTILTILSLFRGEKMKIDDTLLDKIADEYILLDTSMTFEQFLTMKLKELGYHG